jgi:hypothetical protein
MSTLAIGRDRSWRIALVDPTGVIDVACPPDAPGLGCLGETPKIELDVRASHVTGLRGPVECMVRPRGTSSVAEVLPTRRPAAIGLRPEDCYGFLPIDHDDVTPYLYLYRDRPEYEQARARLADPQRVQKYGPIRVGRVSIEVRVAARGGDPLRTRVPMGHGNRRVHRAVSPGSGFAPERLSGNGPGSADQGI